MHFTAPEYLLLLGLSVLNVWAAFILATVRARAKDEILPVMPAELPEIDARPRPSTEQRA